jgi:uroporphyrinogen-III synthase
MTTLTGQRILITRSTEDCDAWAIALKKAGAIPIIFPCITCEEIKTSTVINNLIEDLKIADWIVFTSRRGVCSFANILEKIGKNSLSSQTKIAVIGPATNDSVISCFGRVNLISRDGTAESLGKTLASVLQKTIQKRVPKILILLAENAGNALEQILTEAGCKCTRINIYRTVPANTPATKQPLSKLSADKILLASPSAVTGLINQIDLDIFTEIFTIGPSTSQAARAADLVVTAEASRPSLFGLMETMR